MGIIRLILALSVLAVHSGQTLGRIHFFGGSGITAVETFYMLSGFYMALVLSTRYRGRTNDFYFNRFLRLFPTYWMVLSLLTVGLLAFWLAVGSKFGGFDAFAQSWHKPFAFAWSCFFNLSIVGSDWGSLYAALSRTNTGILIVVTPVWSVAVEISFYLVAPFILRARIPTQIIIFVGALCLRIGLWIAGGHQWSEWLFHFAPSALPFFMGGVLSFHLMSWLEPQAWFRVSARFIGIVLGALLALLICFFEQCHFLSREDWRFYGAVFLVMPFLFTATKDSRVDGKLADFSYPVYLSHGVVLSLYPPLRHIANPAHKIYWVLAITLAVSAIVIRLDRKIQARFKRKVGKVSRADTISSAAAEVLPAQRTPPPHRPAEYVPGAPLFRDGAAESHRPSQP